MRTETSEALGRLVSIFVAAIEGAGEVIPDSAIEQLATDPLGTCEKLNELALSCGAIDEGVDAALAALRVHGCRGRPWRRGRAVRGQRRHRLGQHTR